MKNTQGYLAAMALLAAAGVPATPIKSELAPLIQRIRVRPRTEIDAKLQAEIDAHNAAVDLKKADKKLAKVRRKLMENLNSHKEV